MRRLPVSSFDRARRLVAKTVRKRRKELGLSQEAFAERVGVNVRHFQKIEAAEVNLTLETLCALAAASQIPLREFFR